MDKGIFARIDSFFNDNMDGLTTTISNLFASDLNMLLTSGLTLYVVFYGYMVLAGKIQAPIEDLVWNLARFALLITFMNNGGEWLTLTKEAIKGLSSLGGGDEGLVFIDKQILIVMDLIDRLVDDVPWYAEYFVIAAIWIGFGLSCLPAVLLIMANKISMYFLLALLPLFIFCLMWGWLKESFNQYISALLSNALVIVVVTTTLRAIVLFFTSFDMVGLNVALVCFCYVVAGIFGAFVIKYLAAQCSDLMRVSIEKLPSMKNYERANYQVQSDSNGNSIKEGAKSAALRHSKNMVGSLYNRIKL